MFSALTLTTDIAQEGRHVRFVPTTEVGGDELKWVSRLRPLASSAPERMAFTWSHPFAIKATASISMRAPSRRPATWTALDVGGLCGKTSPRTLENSA